MIIGNVEYLTRSISVGNVERRGRKFRRGLDSKFSFVWVGSAESSSKWLGWAGWIISKKEKWGSVCFSFHDYPPGLGGIRLHSEWLGTEIDKVLKWKVNPEWARSIFLILSLVTDIKDRARGQVKAYPIEDAQAGETKGAKVHVVTQPLWNRCLGVQCKLAYTNKLRYLSISIYISIYISLWAGPSRSELERR